MKKRIKFIIICSFMLLQLLNFSCKKEKDPDDNVDDNPIDSHECSEFSWVFPSDTPCLAYVEAKYVCVECGKVQKVAKRQKEHDLYHIIVDPTCTQTGLDTTLCHNCSYKEEYEIDATNHPNKKYVIDVKATKKHYGSKHLECIDCGMKESSVLYSYNSYSHHGKLKVEGADLKDSRGENFQLVGLSTHGIQWFGRYINYDTIDAIHNEFGINVLRLSMYTSEDGYCDGGESRKKYMYDKVVEGIKIATSLDMYVIVDWHMVGAVDPLDKNPLYYVNEAAEFFYKISKEFADYDNVLYEIMNEPCGTTTWEDCKKYANRIIPIIRNNTADAVILVGNPHWSADLYSVMASPLEGYTNIMYTYHFYAADHISTSQVMAAYNKGFPVFISEHGGMEASGDGSINYSSCEAWYNFLDLKNISYVAWNISNSKGSASILKQSTSSLTDFSDDALKEWGVYYKKITRKRAGLPNA